MRKRRNGREGASIIIALVLLIVFLVIGASVLTAAASSFQSATALQEEKQLYYFARSVATTFEQNMTDPWSGALWSHMNGLIESEPDREEYTCTLSVQNGLPEDLMKEGSETLLNMDPVSIRVERARLDENGALRAVGKMTAKFVVRLGNDEDQTYQMMAEYTYQKPEDENEETGWTLIKYYQE